jgi:hypothetical protein
MAHKPTRYRNIKVANHVIATNFNRIFSDMKQMLDTKSSKIAAINNRCEYLMCNIGSLNASIFADPSALQSLANAVIANITPTLLTKNAFCPFMLL